MSATDPAGNPRPLSCDELYEVAPDLALDMLDGVVRAAALAHLEDCTRCHTEVARLTETAARPLLLAAEVAPPPGFEARVLTRLGLTADESVATINEAESPDDRDPRGHNRPRLLVAALASAVVLMVGLVALVAVVGGGRSDPESSDAPMRTADGAVVGAAELHHEDPARLDIDLTEWFDALGAYDQQVDGRLWLTVDIGEQSDTFLLTSGATTAELTLTGADAAEVRSVAVVDDDGRVWCRASFVPL